jgi:hypothetical protein
VEEDTDDGEVNEEDAFGFEEVAILDEETAFGGLVLSSLPHPIRAIAHRPIANVLNKCLFMIILGDF